MKTAIRAADECLVPAPIDRVWEVLADVAGYARWWPSSLGLRVLAPGLVGAEVEIHPRNGRAFRCKVTGVDPPSSMTMEYAGFVRGAGRWQLKLEGEGTRLCYAIECEAEGWAVRILSLFMDLGAIHSRQMQEVFEALQRRLQGGS